jgi:hypothetical protein
MSHETTIGGQKVELAWTQEVAKRFRFRLSSIGGHPTQRELTNRATADAAVCKILWALLPASELGRYATPEDLFVAIDQETESESISKAIHAVYNDMTPPPEKKRTLKKSPLPGSS